MSRKFNNDPVGDSKIHHVSIKADDIGGHTAQVLIDGKPLKGCTSISFSTSAKGINHVHIDLIATCDIDAKCQISGDCVLLCKEKEPQTVKLA